MPDRLCQKKIFSEVASGLSINVRSRSLGWLCFALLVVSLTGCAHRRKVDWNSRIGHFTYDQAVLELGPPDKEAQLKDGVVIADWLTFRGAPQRDFLFHPRSRYDFHYYHSGPPAPDQFLRLVFSPDGTMQSWKRILR